MRDGVQDNATTRAIARLRRHRYGSLVDALIDEPSFLAKSMFGGMACYLHGRMMLILMDRRPPWRGLLVLTAREAQASLLAELPALVVHPVISKWLYLADAEDDFEACAEEIVARILQDDPRIGVESKPRRQRRTPARAGLAKKKAPKRPARTGAAKKASKRPVRAAAAKKASKRPVRAAVAKKKASKRPARPKRSAD